MSTMPFSPDEGEDAFLTPQEREVVRKLLKYPEEFPTEFGSWIVDYMKTNGEVLKSQVAGLSQIAVNAADSVTATESSSSTSYVALTTPGPTLSGLRDGLYILLYGCGTDAPGGIATYMSPSINGATPLDANAVISTVSLSITTARVLTLQNGNNNEIVMKYKVNGGTGDWGNRWLIAIRYGNV